MMADKKSGRVFAAYLPMLFFGYSRRIGLSKRQVELHKAMTHELTRCRTQSNQRPDKAELVIGGQQQKLPDGNVRTACPYLQPGIRYVGFNGNKGRRRPESFRGRGYRLQTWLHRAKYFDTAAGFDLNSGAEQTRIDNTTCGEHEKIDCKLVKRLFCDLRRLSEVFGLIVCGRHEQRQQWLDLPGLQAQLASQAGRAWLKRCVIRIYTAEDFLVRWRRVLAARMGFAYIPDRGYDEPAKTESQSREYWIGYLRQAKISRKELARGLNVSTALVSLYMSGARPWTKKWRERLETWAAANVNSLPAPS
jgi:hypothetical protein